MKRIYLVENYETVKELKADYRRLVKQMHPDFRKADLFISEKQINEEFNQLKNEYEYILKVLTTGQKLNEKIEEEKINISKNLMDLIKFIARFEDIEATLVGQWLWIDGDTYKIKEELKAKKFRWSNNRKKWYYREDEETKKRYKSNKSFDELKTTHGAYKIKNKESLKIAQ